MSGLKSRSTVIGVVGLLVALFLFYSFWPRAMSVDIDDVVRGPMMVTIDEEARTRVRDAYVVSAPVSGHLLRVDVEPGDTVTGQQTVIARILPAHPTVLDVRTEEQAQASLEAAEAGLTLAHAEVNRAEADADLALAEVERARTLRQTDTVSQAALDRAERAWRAAAAALETARAAVAMREADVENARALLMSPSEAERIAMGVNPHPHESIPLRAPVSGLILRVIQESETVVGAGSPILEIGDPSGDLEIVAELLSLDAVKVSAGDRVIVEKWGGEGDLEGVVKRVEPWGFTKFSALGVEEQRVNAVIDFTGDETAHEKLGHGFRVNIRAVIWEDDNALKAPASALFRDDQAWAVFKVENGRARLTPVEIGQSNGLYTEIVSGLSEGDRIVLYPGNRLADGTSVRARAVQ